MNVNLVPKPIDFKFGEYISKAIDLMKKDFGTIFLAFLFMSIFAIIPFCGLLAYGNFYKVCHKIYKGIPVQASEVFSFDDFMPYFIFQLYILGASLVIIIPMMVLMPFGVNDRSPIIFGISMFFIFAFEVVFIYFLLQAFYIPALITFKKITDIKTAWNISKIMTKGNLIIILLFSFAISILAQLGVVACLIGLFVTLPFYYIANYFAYEDAIQQIEYDEITEIGSKNEF